MRRNRYRPQYRPEERRDKKTGKVVVQTSDQVEEAIKLQIDNAIEQELVRRKETAGALESRGMAQVIEDYGRQYTEKAQLYDIYKGIQEETKERPLQIVLEEQVAKLHEEIIDEDDPSSYRSDDFSSAVAKQKSISRRKAYRWLNTKLTALKKARQGLQGL